MQRDATVLRTIRNGNECQQTNKNNDRRESPRKYCDVNVKGQMLHNSRITNTQEQQESIKDNVKHQLAKTVIQSKIAFWKNIAILRSNISMKTRIRIVIILCYV